jgi:hypothetical protein
MAAQALCQDKRTDSNARSKAMAFVNEYIPEADYVKYDLRKVCAEHNEPNPRRMYSRDWTIDREQDAFLIQTWYHPHAQFSGFAFYWKGEWMFFEMRPTGLGEDATDGSVWTSYLVKGFAVPTALTAVRQEVVDALTQALAVYRGAGVSSSRQGARATATVDFIEGN